MQRLIFTNAGDSPAYIFRQDGKSLTGDMSVVEMHDLENEQEWQRMLTHGCTKDKVRFYGHEFSSF